MGGWEGGREGGRRRASVCVCVFGNVICICIRRLFIGYQTEQYTHTHLRRRKKEEVRTREHKRG